MLNKFFDVVVSFLVSVGKFACKVGGFFTGHDCGQCEPDVEPEPKEDGLSRPIESDDEFNSVKSNSELEFDLPVGTKTVRGAHGLITNFYYSDNKSESANNLDTKVTIKEYYLGTPKQKKSKKKSPKKKSKKGRRK